MDTDKARAAALLTLAAKADDEPTTGVEAWALCEALGFEPDYVRVLWQKLARRPAGAVRACSQAVREARPEDRVRIISEFAREFAAIPREERAS